MCKHFKYGILIIFYPTYVFNKIQKIIKINMMKNTISKLKIVNNSNSIKISLTKSNITYYFSTINSFTKNISKSNIYNNNLHIDNNFKSRTSILYKSQLKNFSIFVKTGETPNPNFLKFYPGKEVMEGGNTYDMPSKKEALISPLASNLFDIKGINRVFYGSDYISVGKEELVDWSELKPLIIDEIVKFFTKNEDLFIEKPASEDTDILDTDSEAVQLIKEIIACRIRPVVQEDGGDLKYIAFDETDGVVYVQMKGSCSGCPSSGVTLKNGIEKMLTHYVAEVKSVEEYEEDEIDV